MFINKLSNELRQELITITLFWKTDFFMRLAFAARLFNPPFVASAKKFQIMMLRSRNRT
jgi:hypothetical protein